MMLQLWEVRTPLTRVLEAMSWSNEAATHEEREAKPHTC